MTDEEKKFTGKYIAVLREGSEQLATEHLEKRAGLKVASTADRGLTTLESASGADALVLDEIGAAVIDSPPDQVRALDAMEADSPFIAVEPEQLVYALQQDEDERASVSVDYLRGYRDAAAALAQQAEKGILEAGGRAFVEKFNETRATWGLQIMGVDVAGESAEGVRVAVLDTGFGPHPHFDGRVIHRQSFVPGESPDDGHGHGTHCIGTAMGSRAPQQGPRFGVATGAHIYAGKVLGNAGSGRDGWILAGINWAVGSRCAIISMSLGSRANTGDPPSPVYEAIAARALDRGILIVAAAGNESRRSQGIISAVGRPANCPSIFAVGAIDSALRIADFSCRGINPNGGEVNIVAPGVDVLSTWPFPPGMRRLNGTSMATPHVAGLAAMYARRFGITGRQLWRKLENTARPLSGLRADLGSGLARWV